jgi:hypothetical protein
MRQESKNPRQKKQKAVIKAPARSVAKVSKQSKQNLPPGSGLIGEHDLSNAAERKIRRTPHTKSTVLGSDTDGQVE